MNYHTYGGYLLYPWGYINSGTPDQSTFQSWGAAMTSYNGYSYGRAGQLLYPVNGEQNDWFYGGNSMQGILSFTPEVDDNGFWGGQNDTTLIADFCEECRYMNIWLCMTAPGFVGISEEEGLESAPVLDIGSVTPNPVYSVAAFSVTVPISTQVEIAVYDTAGRIVDVLGNGQLSEGENSLTWAVPEDMATGVYLLRAADNTGNVVSRRFTVLR
jgi:hypothetical protein